VKAIRSGVWFRSLPRIDRVLIDLTIRVAENIRSKQLAKSIFEVVRKLEELLESRIMRIARTVGKAAAEKISEIAQKLGYIAAKAWAADGGFAVYLAVMHTNK
jgi:ribosome maturation protein Sdo1